MTDKKDDKRPLEEKLKDFKLDPELVKAAGDVEEENGRRWLRKRRVL